MLLYIAIKGDKIKMGQLISYVDIKDYCSELARITNLDDEVVEELVKSVFSFIKAGSISATRGFVYIEKALSLLMEQQEEIRTYELSA